jgi:predicted transposase YbfD/YdcC
LISSATFDKGHGRLETRLGTLSQDITWLRERHPDWKDLKSIIEIESTREIKGAITTEKRYYINSLLENPAKISDAIRQHSGVENQLHWVLDIIFSDDQSRIRKSNAPRNIAIVKKQCLIC